MIALVGSIRLIEETIVDEDEDQPVVNRARPLSPAEREIRINVYKYVKRPLPVNYWAPVEYNEERADNTGQSRPAAAMIRDRKGHRRPITEMVDSQTLAAIRRKIYLFFHEMGHGVPRPENILREVNEDDRLPNFDMPIFRRVLRHLKYRHYITRNRHGCVTRSETFSIPVV